MKEEKQTESVYPGLLRKAGHTAYQAAATGLVSAGIGLVGGAALGGITDALIPGETDLVQHTNDLIEKGTKVEPSTVGISNPIIKTIFSFAKNRMAKLLTSEKFQEGLKDTLGNARFHAHYGLPLAGATAGAATGLTGGIIVGTVKGGVESFTETKEKPVVGKYTEKLAISRMEPSIIDR